MPVAVTTVQEELKVLLDMHKATLPHQKVDLAMVVLQDKHLMVQPVAAAGMAAVDHTEAQVHQIVLVAEALATQMDYQMQTQNQEKEKEMDMQKYQAQTNNKNYKMFDMVK